MKMECAAEALAEGFEYGDESAAPCVRFRLSLGIVAVGVGSQEDVEDGVVLQCGMWAEFLVKCLSITLIFGGAPRALAIFPTRDVFSYSGLDSYFTSIATSSRLGLHETVAWTDTPQSFFLMF